MRQLVVLTGKAGAGKSTVAEHLVREHDFVRVRFAGPLKAMAAALGLNEREIDGDLKEVPCAKLTMANYHVLCDNAPDAFEALGVNLFDHDSLTAHPLVGNWPLSFALITFLNVVAHVCREGGEAGATPRLLMQRIGTEWGREQIDKDIWINAWRAKVDHTDEDALIVIDDCRFPNEEQVCASLPNVSATFIRILRQTEGVKAGPTEQAHESEAHVLGYHYSVENNSTPEDVGARVYALFRGKIAPNAGLSDPNLT